MREFMIRLKDIMSRAVVTLSPDTTIRSALEKLSSSRMSGAPVMDEKNVCGIISLSDIVGVIASDPAGAEKKSVADVMTRRVHSLGPDAPARQAALMMREQRIHRVVVIDD